jgi:hypothetical protein
MLAAAQFLARLGALDGEVPQYGDWDEGRILAVAPVDGLTAGSVRLALAVGGTGAPALWRAEHDECAWYIEDGVPETPELAVEDGGVVGGGISRCVAGDLKVWFKWGGGTSHQHADLSSVSMWSPDGWVLGDPGTGTYNGPIKVRNYFRCSVAHNVLRVNDQDQLLPHRAFRWEHAATGSVGTAIRNDGLVVMWGAHDAYRRRDDPHLVARAVVVSPGGIGVVDWVDGAPAEVTLSISLGPSVEWDAQRTIARSSSGQDWKVSGIEFTEILATPSNIGGVWSDTYGQWAPSVRLEADLITSAPSVWAVTRASDEPFRDPDSHIEILGCRLELHWAEQGAELVMTLEGQRSVRRIVIP